MGDVSDNVSFVHPRNPSIFFGNRMFEAGKTNLLSRFEDEAGQTRVSKDEKIKVYLRIKPTKKDAAQMLAPPQDQTFEIKDSQTLLVRSLKDSTVHEFKFTKVFSGNASQERVYNECVHDLVKDFISGQNCLLFAYGTSSAGKTYTIQGTCQEPGIIPQAINVLFNSIRGKQSETCRFKPDMVTQVVKLEDKAVKQEIAYRQQIMAWSQNKSHVYDSKISGTSSEKGPDNTSSSVDCQVISDSFRDMREKLNDLLLVNTEGKGSVFSTWVSFAEIYNEKLYDLLQPVGSGQKRKNLALGIDNKGQVYIKGLQHICVNSADEAYHVLLYGKHNLKFAATGLNTLSSRSHSIFTIKLLQHVESEHSESVRISAFSFCDLAGSESAKKTKNVGERLKESHNINTSLLALGRCLRTIRYNQLKKSENMVPFRDSNLTRLFQRALAGEESLAVMVNVNPSSVLREETLHVLKFSAIARQLIPMPARHKKRVPRLSSFSQYVSKSSTLVSDGTFEGDSTTLSQLKSGDIQHLLCQNQIFLNEIGELKKQLAVERETRLAREAEVRQEVCEYFSNFWLKEQAECKSRLEEMQQQLEQMSDWRVKKLEDYYQNQQKRKRCDEDGSEDGSSALDDADAEVATLTEKLRVMNELLCASQKNYNELREKHSKLMFELSFCQMQVKNAEKLKEAAKAKCEGDQKCLIDELDSQLAAAKEELFKKEEKIQKLNGVLEDAVLDYKQLEDDLKATEKERNDFELKLAEKESELGYRLDALNDQQQILDDHLRSLDEKDERIEILEKELKELQAQYDGDMETVKLRTQELEAEQKMLLEDKQLLTSGEEELKRKLQESEEKLLQGEALQRIYQEEMQKANRVVEGLKHELRALEEAQKNNIKEKTDAQNCAEELCKRLEESTIMSQKEISELKVQLKTCMANEEVVRLLKEKLEQKSHKCEQLKSENESLKRSLEVKEIELTRFKENRDQLLRTYENMLKKGKETERCKRDIQGYQQMFVRNTPTPKKLQCEETRQTSNEDVAKKMKACCVMLNKLDIPKKCNTQCGETEATVLSDSSQTNVQSNWTRSRKKNVDENTNPAFGSLDIKHTSSMHSKTLGKRKRNEKSRYTSRRKNLFPCNLDVSLEIMPVETEEITHSLSPSRILRSQRM